MYSLFSLITFLSHLVLHISASVLVRRAEKCDNLQAASNNGNRKIAIVIDSSGSMESNDPTYLRLTAASNVIDGWLIPQSKASSKKPADLVTVIDFSDAATLDYPLGDPSGANASLSQIGATGGTLISSGVEMAIEQLTSSGSGSTDKRSGILVFTDGEDSDTEALVAQINRAGSLGIRVSFGFLDSSASSQDGEVLAAIMQTGGQYSTVFSPATANSFVNLVLVNGLTTNDNPEGSQSQLVGGLSVSRFISGSETVTVSYDARDDEIINFTVQSINAGDLEISAVKGGRMLDNDTITFRTGTLLANTGQGGKIDIKVKAENAPKDSIFTVGAISNLPTQNCTVGVGGGGGLSTGGKAGVGIGVVAIIAGICVGSFYAYKHLYVPKTHVPLGEPTVIHDPGMSDMLFKTPQVQTYPLQPIPPPVMPPPNQGHAPPKKSSVPQNPPNSTSDPTPPQQDHKYASPPQDNYIPPQSDVPPQHPGQPPENFELDHDISDLSDVSWDSDNSKDDKNKKRRKYKIRNDKCSCLQCPHCFDCGSRCSPDCSIPTASLDSITGGRDCGPDCRVHCKHKDKYDCSMKKAHKKHRHRCHRCRAHNDAVGEGREHFCNCWSCEVCTDCTSDCGPGGCPSTEGLIAGNGHVHVRHRCREHLN